jgi:hypothetical protein
MQTFMFRLILASFLSMMVSIALSADLPRASPEYDYTPQDQMGCSCDAPGIVGLVCATPHRCREMSGLCVGSCTQAVVDDSGCACDAPGVDPVVIGTVCATPYRCRALGGLCVGHC